jgi:hypothetical protein
MTSAACIQACSTVASLKRLEVLDQIILLAEWQKAHSFDFSITPSDARRREWF